MTDRTARGIFFGTLCSLDVSLTVHTHRSFAMLAHADALDEPVAAGERVFERHSRCLDWLRS